MSLGLYIGRVRAKSDTNAGSVVIDVEGSGASEGDLVVVMLGCREPQVVLTLPAGVEWGARADTDATDPSAFVFWHRATVESLASGLPVPFDRGTKYSYEAASYDGDQVDWTEPLGSRAHHEGNINNPNPQWITASAIYPAPGGAKSQDWLANNPRTQGPPPVDMAMLGRAAAFNRANQGPVSGGAQWNVDEGGNLAGAGDSTGLRARYGGQKNPGNSGVNRSSIEYNAGSNTGNARTSTVSYSIQPLYRPRPADGYPAVGSAPDFSYVQQAGTLLLVFTNELTESQDSWLWSFGDNTTSESSSVAHQYAVPGDYTVQLVATNPQGDNSAEVQPQVVTVTPPPPVAVMEWAQAVGGWTVELLDRSRGTPDTWLWEVWNSPGHIGLPDATYNTQNAEHTFPGAGLYSVRLTVSNSSGVDSVDEEIRLDTELHVPDRPDDMGVVLEIKLSSGAWVQATCELQSASWGWGTNQDDGPLSVIKPTNLAVTLIDPDRDWDAENPSSPYWGQWNAGSSIRLRWGTQEFIGEAWHGFISDYGHDLELATFACSDDLSRLQQVDTDIENAMTLPAQTTSGRMSDLLDVARWPSGLRRIEQGGTSLQGVTITEQSVWESLVDVQQSDLGRIYLGHDGYFSYDGRVTTWAPADPVMVFGCDPPGETADVGIQTLAVGGAVGNLVNDLRVGTITTEPERYVRLTSQALYGRHTAVRDDLIILGNEVDAYATFLLDRLDRPTYQGRSIAFRVSPDMVNKLEDVVFLDVVRIYDDTHGAVIDLKARALGVVYSLDRNVIWAEMTVTKDAPLTERPQSSTIDTEAEWLGALRLDNVKVDPAGVLEYGSA